MKTPLTDAVARTSLHTDESLVRQAFAQQLERDFWTLFSRLIVPWKHDPLSFAPESAEVMERMEAEFQKMIKGDSHEDNT